MGPVGAAPGRLRQDAGRPPPGASAAEAATAFNNKSVGKRIAIVAAGPIFNLILAVFLYAGLNLAGTQEPVAVIAQPAADTPAARAGLIAGDRILAIDGQEVASWSDARWRLMDLLATGGRARIEVGTPGGGAQQRELVLPANAMDPASGDRWRRPASAWPSPSPRCGSSTRAAKGRRPACARAT